MKIQKNRPVVAAIILAIGSLVGIMFASLLLGLRIGGPGPGCAFADAIRDWAILSAGAVLGGLLFSWVGKRLAAALDICEGS